MSPLLGIGSALRDRGPKGWVVRHGLAVLVLPVTVVLVIPPALRSAITAGIVGWLDAEGRQES